MVAPERGCRGFAGPVPPPLWIRSAAGARLVCVAAVYHAGQGVSIATADYADGAEGAEGAAGFLRILCVLRALAVVSSAGSSHTPTI